LTGLTLTALKGAIKSFTITAAIYTVSALTNYNFQITPTNPLTNAGFIRIIFPSTIGVAAGTRTYSSTLLTGNAGILNTNANC